VLSRSHPQQAFSDNAIRQFLLGRLDGKDLSAFERALFLDSQLEQRTRLEEIALADDYVTRRLRGKELQAFVEAFSFSTARLRQTEVSRALRECFAPAHADGANVRQRFERPVWKMAFATMILIMMLATIWVATKERRIVKRFLPHRTRPAAVTTPTPEVAHHAAHASERPAHREDSSEPPSHEAAAAIVLDSTSTEENAPIVTFATVPDQNVRVQLLLSEAFQSTYRAELIKRTGELVFSEAEIPIDANADRVNFDIPRENFAAADFQIRLTRTADGKQTIYLLRVR
jgi:hypothetical protein